MQAKDYTGSLRVETSLVKKMRIKCKAKFKMASCENTKIFDLFRKDTAIEGKNWQDLNLIHESVKTYLKNF